MNTPPNEDLLIQEVQQAINQRDLTIAKEKLTQLISIRPKDTYLQNIYASLLIEDRQFDQAENILRLSLEIDPNSKDAKGILSRPVFSLDLSDITNESGEVIGNFKRPCALFFRYKYVPGSLANQRAHEQFIMTNPFRQSELGSVIDYYLDEAFHENAPNIGRRLINVVEAVKPDVIVLSSYELKNPNHPNFQLLQLIRRSLSIPLVVIWHDTCGETSPFIELDPYITNSIDLHVLADSNSCLGKFPNIKFLRLPPPCDSKLFYPASNAELDIPVSFVGSIGGYRSIREEYINFVKQNGIPIHLQTGGQVKDPISWNDYASILRRSKISLNFSQTVNNEHQLKARVIEAMFSGSMLLENRNNETASFFTEGVHFVSFDTKEDLVDKIKYYLSNEQERIKIANAGMIAAQENHSGKAFFGKIFNELKQKGYLANY